MIIREYFRTCLNMPEYAECGPKRGKTFGGNRFKKNQTLSARA